MVDRTIRFVKGSKYFNAGIVNWNPRMSVFGIQVNPRVFIDGSGYRFISMIG